MSFQTKKLVLGFFLCFSTVGQAKATEPGICRDIGQLRAAVASCEDNQLFAEAAVICLRQLEAMVKKEHSKAVAALKVAKKAHVEDGRNNQKNTMGGGEANYQISEDTLDRLIAIARIAREQVSSYMVALVPPDEVAYVEAGMDLDEVLAGSPCHQQPDEVLIMVEEDVYKIIDDLEKTKLASTNLKQSSTLNINQHKIIGPGTGTLKSGVQSAPTPKAKDWNASDISGTEKKQKK